MVNGSALNISFMSESSAILNRPWFGPAYLEAGWAPAPRYLLRRARILHHMKKMAPGRVLEIGSASGALLSELAEVGFQCTGLETSAEAISLAQQVNVDNRVCFQTEADSAWGPCFDYVFSFEVLEHIEHDRAALVQWASWLRPGGRMLLSVPAHPRLWNARDVWAGHFRRYRRSDLKEIFQDAGLIIEEIECYGFPLANILELMIAPSYRRYMKSNRGDRPEIDKAAQTAASGIERTTHVKAFPLYAKAPGSFLMRSMIFVQQLFLKIGFGNGYLVVARKPGPNE